MNILHALEYSTQNVRMRYHPRLALRKKRDNSNFVIGPTLARLSPILPATPTLTPEEDTPPPGIYKHVSPPPLPLPPAPSPFTTASSALRFNPPFRDAEA